MIELLEQYSLSDILIFIVIFALAIKSLITFFDWAIERFQRVFNKEYSKLNKKKQFENKLNHNKKALDELQANQKIMEQALEDLSGKIDMLIESDRDDIKSFITREHHRFCYQVGWIDDFSLDCIEKRYKHYTDEGGNTFISGFMDELRALPKLNPAEE